jgi:hypothetical protein
MMTPVVDPNKTRMSAHRTVRLIASWASSLPAATHTRSRSRIPPIQSRRSCPELASKQLELLRELVPGAAVFGVLADHCKRSLVRETAF